MTLVYFDLETGGVEMRHPVIQLAAIAVTDGEAVADFEEKISFDVAACDQKALEINHYTPEAWAEAIAPAVAVERFAQWLRPYCTQERVSKGGNPYRVALLAGYNALTFDYPRLKALFGTAFLPCDLRVRDVLQLALFYFDGQPSKPENYKLTTVAAALGIATYGAHDALSDCRMAHRVHAEIMMREQW